MLNTQNRGTDGAPHLEAPQQTKITLSEFIALFRRQRGLILTFFVATLALGVGYLIVSPPQYIARVNLIIDARRAQPFLQQALVSELPLDTATVESQVELIRSGSVLTEVIQKLNLSTDKELTGEGFILSALQTTRSFAGLAKISQETRVRKHVEQNLYVSRIGRTYVLEIRYRSVDPAKAAAIANAFAESYIMDQLKATFEATRRDSEWLEGRLAELREDVMKADHAVQDYIVENNLIEAGSGRTLAEQQLNDVNSQLIQVRAQVSEAKARLDRILAVNDNEIANPAVTDALDNPVITKVREQYLSAVGREADFSARYGTHHPAVAELRNEIAQLRSAARDELHRIAEAYRSDYVIAQSREQALQASLNEAVGLASYGKRAGVSLRLLESSAQSYRRIYDSFLQRFTDSIQQQSFPRIEARVITPARLEEKSHPNIPLVLGGAVMVGLLGGVALAFAREQVALGPNTAHHVEDLAGPKLIRDRPVGAGGA